MTTPRAIAGPWTLDDEEAAPTPTPLHWSIRLTVYTLIVGFSVAAWVFMFEAVRAFAGHPAGVPVLRPAIQQIQGKHEPIATFDPTDVSLTVSKNAPRELLVCLRGSCRLVEEWLGR
jgi:hypothetical protein